MNIRSIYQREPQDEPDSSHSFNTPERLVLLGARMLQWPARTRVVGL